MKALAWSINRTQRRAFGSCSPSQINGRLIACCVMRQTHNQFSCKLCGFVDIITAELETDKVETLRENSEGGDVDMTVSVRVCLCVCEFTVCEGHADG